jgi:arylsulfatase A-like enzyme
LAGRPGERRKRFARSELLGERNETRFRMVRDERWKWVAFPSAPARLFDLEADPEEAIDWAEDPPPDAPIAKLRDLAARGGTWEQLARQRADDGARAGALETLSQGAVQYRLSSGRVVEADAQIYPPCD